RAGGGSAGGEQRVRFAAVHALHPYMPESGRAGTATDVQLGSDDREVEVVISACFLVHSDGVRRHVAVPFARAQVPGPALARPPERDGVSVETVKPAAASHLLAGEIALGGRRSGKRDDGGRSRDGGEFVHGMPSP